MPPRGHSTDGGVMTSYLVSMVGASPDVRCAVGAALQVYAEAVD
ncbi:hypothetical protein BIFBIF_00716 [Bifidobacterium bifidum ATCC 29521 = JCM 1255 = DSM 20456]|nr:hypothetical protein BIFBIF_00716 [Bifidobacterium bifidum ATCC 29521 = JCM 1255 = DSM 20456]